MSANFLDSSALVKRYSREVGTKFVIGLLRPSANNQIYVARIALVEVISALTRQKQNKIISSDALTKAISRFRRIFIRQFRIVETDAFLIEEASRLAEKHILRGYDAVQLASALEVRKVRQSLNASPLIFVSADAKLNQSAQNEGLLVENPLNYP